MFWYSLTVVLCFVMKGANSQFECGPHGKFEYCIDAIPGCVIGCHCHPGYYFDTDTKVCEPNVKLSHDYRRSYIPAPTRILSPSLSTTEPPTTTEDKKKPFQSPEEQKIEEITNDADELGDWLYNQFFKTIENQVINKTSDVDLPTRRSGSDLKVSPTRKSNKHRRRRKKKSKKKNMKSKLLQITDNDSMFDSSSGDSSSTEESSDTSSDSDTDTDDSRDHEKKHSNNYGHKKILIYNKKPKPPLPSFIFLPNMETPYYPPVGIPSPPAAVPMYPMVPVPPVMGPMFPYPAIMAKQDNNPVQQPSTTTQASSNTEISSVVTAASTTTIDTTPITETADTAAPDETEEPPKDATRTRYSKSKSKKAMQTNSLSQMAREKFLQKMREKMKRKNKLNDFFNDYQIQQDSILSDPQEQNVIEELSPASNVDFKYLSQLIHKTNLNDTQRIPMDNGLVETKSPMDASAAKKMWEHQIFNTRKSYNNNIRPQIDPYQAFTNNNNNNRRSYNNDMNDSYYTNLGRQIASVIKKIDATADKKVDIEIERTPYHSTMNHVFSEMNNSPKSYWERSVRSPLMNLESYNNDNLNQNNADLYKLENEVVTIASTQSPLSLQDLETLIYNIKKSKPNRKEDELKKDVNIIKIGPSKIRFNLNFLPKETRTPYNDMNSRTQTDNTNEPNITIPNVLYRKSLPFTNEDILQNLNHTEINNVFNRYPTRIPNIVPLDSNIPKMVIYKPVFPKYTVNDYSINTPPNDTNNINPHFYYKRNKFNIYDNTLNYPRNEYSLGKSLPISIPIIQNQYQREKPSYFHHQIEYFDYFDHWN